MTDAKGVVLAFATRRKRRQAIFEFDGVQLLATTGKHFMWIGLMTDVPYQPIFRRIEYVMQSDGELYGAQTCGEMTAALTDGVDQELTEFRSQRFELRDGQTAQVSRGMNVGQQGQGRGLSHWGGSVLEGALRGSRAARQMSTTNP